MNRGGACGSLVGMGEKAIEGLALVLALGGCFAEEMPADSGGSSEGMGSSESNGASDGASEADGASATSTSGASASSGSESEASSTSEGIDAGTSTDGESTSTSSSGDTSTASSSENTSESTSSAECSPSGQIETQCAENDLPCCAPEQECEPFYRGSVCATTSCESVAVDCSGMDIEECTTCCNEIDMQPFAAPIDPMQCVCWCY